MSPRFAGRPVQSSGPRFGSGRRVSYFQTDRGPASYTTGEDGSLWLETEGGYSGGPERFGNLQPIYATPPDQQWQGDGSVARPRQRTLSERFSSTFEDARRRNPIVAAGRSAISGVTGPDGSPGLGAAVVREERARRDNYEQSLEGDRWDTAPTTSFFPAGERLLRGAATLGGALAGGAVDPVNMIGGGGKTILGRIVANAGVNAAGDALTQGLDMQSGVQDRYSAAQTAFAAGIGGVLQGGLEIAPHAPALAARGGRGVARFTGRLVGSLDGRLANPVPDFAGPSLDTGPIPLGSSGRGATAPNPTPRRRARATASPAVQRAISGAAEAYGVSPSYLDALALRESGYDPSIRADTSTATGLYQFTEGTWLETLRRHGRELGIPDAAGRSASDLLRLRTDADLNARAAAVHTRDNAAELRSVLGRAPSDGELYAAHFAGVGGARRLLTADPEVRAADLLPEAARANRSIFFDGRRARSVAEVLQGFNESFGAGSTVPPASRAGGTGGAPRFDGRPVESARPAPEAYGRMDPIGRDRPDYAALAEQDLRGTATPDMVTAPRADAPQPRFNGRPLNESPQARAGDFSFEPIHRDAALPVRQEWDNAAFRDQRAREAQAGLQPVPRFDGRPVRSLADEYGANPTRLSGPMEAVRTPRFAGRLVGDLGPMPSPRQGLEAGEPFGPLMGGRLAMGEGTRLPIDLSAYGSRLNTSQPGPVPSSNISGIANTLRPGAVPRGEGGAFSGQSISGLARDLRSALGITQRQGRVGMRGALGTYDTGSGVVRTKAVQELDVLAHEATHALEYERSGPALRQALQTHEAEIVPMAYAGAAPGALRQEGFAEFGRLYLTNPQVAQTRAPNFYQAFEAALQADNPRVAAQMKAIQSAYGDLLRADSIEVAKSSLAYTGRKGPLGEFVRDARERGIGPVVRQSLSRLYTALIDDKNPIRAAVDDLSRLYLDNSGRKLELRPSQNPYTLARLTPDSNAAGLNDVLHGVTPYRGLDPEGPSLADALETAGIHAGVGGFSKDALAEFDVYLIARRMVHEWGRFARGDLPRPPDKNTLAFHQQVIGDAEALHPSWANAAGQVYEWLNNLWRKEFESGLITRQAYENGLNNHPDYVPLMRDVSDKGRMTGKPRGALQFAGGVDAFEGSTRDVRSPLSVMIQRAYALNGIIKRNDVLIALDDLGQAAGAGAGAIVERLPAKEVQSFTINAAEALRKTADDMGLSGRDLSTIQKIADDAANEDAVVQMFRQTEFSPRKGEQVVFVWRNGDKTPLLLPDGETGKALFDALTGMNKELRSVAVDMMALGTGILRQGVTLSPEFAAANLIRDTLSTWMLSGTSFKPVVGTIQGAREVLRPGRDSIRYANAGGLRGGANVAAFSHAIPQTDADAIRQLQVLDRRGFRIRRAAGNPLRALAEVTDFSETATRLGVFKAAFSDAKRAGLDDYDALIQSGFLSRDYLDFGRRGSKMVAASRIVTFLNASLQGLDKTVRVAGRRDEGVIREDWLRSALTPLMKSDATRGERTAYANAVRLFALVSTAGAFGLALRSLYADDPEYQEIGDALRATHWVFRAGGHWVFVPKPFELAAISNILERAYEGHVLNDPTWGDRLVSDMLHTVAPPTEVPTIAVPFQIAQNRDHLGRPIVPDHLRGTVDPAMQFNAYTSDLGKLIGRTFNVSPAVVDHVITGIGGSLGRYALQGSNMVGEHLTGRPRTAAGPEDMFVARRFIRSVARGATSQAEFWDQVSRDGGEMTRAEGSYRALLRNGQDEAAVAYLNGLPSEERAYIAAKTLLPEGMSIIHPLVRTEKAVAVISDFRRDVRSGELRDSSGRIVHLTPEDRRSIDSALADMAMANMRRALTLTGIRGWEQRGDIDPSPAIRRLANVSPDAFQQLQIRMMLERTPHEMTGAALPASDQQWDMLRPQLEQQANPAVLLPYLRARRLQSGDRSARYQEGQKLIGGAYQ